MTAPLAGVRVVEVASFVAVPAAGAMLGDLGAEVIKVELPPVGELYRRSKPKYAGYATDFPENPSYHMDNRGKRVLMLDLTRTECCAALARLVDTADILLTNLLPQRRVRYGVDHETLLARKPELIVAAINGYGSGGEQADWPAFDYSAYWARTGMMDTLRDVGREPSMLRPGVGDHAAASNLVCGILAAMRLKDRDGKGRYVETSLLQTGLYILGADLSTALVTGEPVPRHDRSNPANPLWNSYRVAQDRWIMLVMIDPNRYWPRVCTAIGLPDLVNDERFADPFVRAANSRELVGIFDERFAEKTIEEWRSILDAAGLIWAPVATIEEALKDPQVKAMGYFQTLEHDSAGNFETVGTPFRIEGENLGSRAAAPPVDRDGRAILREAGLADDEIDKLLV